MLLGQPKRLDTEILLATNTAILEFCSDLIKRMESSPQDEKFTKIELWTNGFIDALNELEQSCYGSMIYSKQIHKTFVEEMNAKEEDAYRLHVYFYKNALIRIFSTLDKLGYFLNDLLSLKTEKVKARFSFYTVIRNMYKLQIHSDLEQPLFQLKKRYQESMMTLRNKRNMEIHYINAEMLDDLQNLSKSQVKPIHIEELGLNMFMLNEGYEMVCHSLQTVFTYAKKMERVAMKEG